VTDNNALSSIDGVHVLCHFGGTRIPMYDRKKRRAPYWSYWRMFNVFVAFSGFLCFVLFSTRVNVKAENIALIEIGVIGRKWINYPDP